MSGKLKDTVCLSLEEGLDYKSAQVSNIWRTGYEDGSSDYQFVFLNRSIMERYYGVVLEDEHSL